MPHLSPRVRWLAQLAILDVAVIVLVRTAERTLKGHDALAFQLALTLVVLASIVVAPACPT